MIKSVKQVSGVTFKKCSCCDKWKSLNLYYNETRGIAGTQSRCKECVKIKTREYALTPGGKLVKSKSAIKLYNKQKGKYNKDKIQKSSQAKAKYALKIGKIPGTDIEFKRGECAHSDASCSPSIQFHHDKGYDNPYDGIFLCAHHHKLEHIRLKEGK